MHEIKDGKIRYLYKLVDEDPKDNYHDIILREQGVTPGQMRAANQARAAEGGWSDLLGG